MYQSNLSSFITIPTNRTILLGIVVIVLALLGAGFLALIGGILIILDAVL
jgi:hypothetical protein